MEDLVLNAEADRANLDDIPVAVVGVQNTVILTSDGEFLTYSPDEALRHVSRAPHLVVNRVRAARRLGVASIRAYDALELFAFVRPARFCLPTLQGLLNVLNLSDSVNTFEDEALALKSVSVRLLADMAAETFATRAGATQVLTMMAQAGWAWGPLAMKALQTYKDTSREDGLAVWRDLPDWEDDGPPPAAGDEGVEPLESTSRLGELLGKGAEVREGQLRYAASAVHAFKPREFQEGPNIQLLEAGTGTGKTLAYIAPASLWSERNDAPVWLATYTKNLQRQLDQELTKLYPDPRIKAKRAVIRKGRENYACLLNIEETLRAVIVRGNMAGKGSEDRDRILMGLVLRWARYSRDGDMMGGDFPSYLGAHFGAGRIAGLTDKRGECLYGACAHYRKCFIERVIRKAKNADLVVANHALVMAHIANRIDDPSIPKRYVFDEGHHVFDAADSAFAVHLTGQEGADLRRWLRGKEQGGSTRARGLKNRVEELVVDDDTAKTMLEHVVEAARVLPADNWLGRVSGAAATSRFEVFLSFVRAHVFSRTVDLSDTSVGRPPQPSYALEAALNNPSAELIEAALKLAEGLDQLLRPMAALAARLSQLLDEDADSLDSSTRGRLESAARSLSLRADMVKSWVAMTMSLAGDGKVMQNDFVDWFEIDRIDARERDIGMYRHFIDPTLPFANVVLSATHGTLITSATLRDKVSFESNEQNPSSDHWASADMRTGAQHLLVAPKRLSVPSPFDYAGNTRIIIVGDVNKNDPTHVAAAYRALMMASGGGALGLFTAISRLKATYSHIAADMEDMGLPLLAQHIDPMDTATLVDMFRADENSCLLGTDAVRDGVDVPGHALRLIVFDRVPWQRPTLLHRARRSAFGGWHYDDMLTRLKFSQAYGRLIRTASDRGVFVMLDGQTPTRLLTAFPPDVRIDRIGLADAVKSTHKFFNSE